MNRRQITILSIATALSAAFLTFDVVPLGVSGEWVWERHTWNANPVEALDRLLIPIIGGAVFFAVAVLAKPSANATRFRAFCSFGILLIGSAFWLNSVQQAAPSGHRDLKPYWVLYDPSSSGYFFEAVNEIKDTREFLRGYESRMKQGEVLHVGTHPPGLFLLSKACLNVCESYPRLVSILNGLENSATRQAFRVVEAEANYAPRLKENQLAALHLLSMLSSIAVVLTILPLVLLCRQYFDIETTWKICCLWPTLPCLAVFLPKSDVLFPLTCTASLALAVLAMSGGRKVLWAIPAGAILWFGMMLSLAHLPIPVVLVVYALIRAVISNGETLTRASPLTQWRGKVKEVERSNRRDAPLSLRAACEHGARFILNKTLRRDAVAGIVCVATIVACCFAWNVSTDCNFFNVWRLNLTNHAGFYEQFQRTWYKWLLVNPVELMLAVGLPVFVLAMFGVRQAVCDFRKRADSSSTERNHAAFLLATTLVLMALWLSGKNQGEAARLWCFLTPWIVVSCGRLLLMNRVGLNPGAWRALLLLQLAASIATVSFVSGFSF